MPDDPFIALEALYASIPATTCDDGCGGCCSLTDATVAEDMALMWPLYRIEYLHIAEGVSPEFASFMEERPRQCPFLRGGFFCTIYDIRPLICRLYGLRGECRFDLCRIADGQAAPTGDYLAG
ncbi:hypothetical protein LCGC14_2327230, partial [marine sediment metagenome]